MHLDKLTLTNYRNIAHAEITLPERLSVLIGANAQGKSNLLEAVYMLATTKAARANSDAQLINSDALSDVLPAARIAGEVRTADGPLKVEIVIVTRPHATNGAVPGKTVKINGVSRRISDAVGRMTAVLFTADDMEMVTGSPSLRRRYLDIMLSQVDPMYSASRSRFERLLTQRNSLLKRVREGLAREDELAYWDCELATHGGLLVHRRHRALRELAEYAPDWHSRLASDEKLSLKYLPGIADLRELQSEEAGVQEQYAGALVTAMGRDVAAGMTLSGPHRDDVEFTINGFPASGFASRAQQRTLALSLRLAEARLLFDHRGEPPILLLDDILSEMDHRRREMVMTSLAEVEQVVVTGTEAEQFPPGFLATAKLFAVDGGSIQTLSRPTPPA